MTIQIAEAKLKGGAPSTVSDYFSFHTNNHSAVNTPAAVSITTSANNVSNEQASFITAVHSKAHREEDVPSRRRHEPRHKGSLVVYDDQPLCAVNVAQRLAAQETNASTPAIPVYSYHRVGELGSNLKKDPSTMTATTTEKSPLNEKNHRRNSVSMVLGKLDGTQIYEPPTFALLNQDTDVPPPIVRDRLVIEDFPKHTITTAWIKMLKQGLSEWLRLPVIVCRGTEDGPVVGITAAVHGNELNGVPCIHRVVSDIDVNKLHGTVVAVPCVNVSGYLKFTREFADGRDLNRNFPGREDGFASQVYCYQLMNKVISQFNYLIDLHTASFGRVNSYYVRADMNDPISAIMARLQQPQIVLHNSGQDGTLRSAASARGIRAITVEIGNPQLFQNQYVQVRGIINARKTWLFIHSAL